MKVRYSPIISQASGAAGPVVASRWKGVNYVRERIVPGNPNTEAQQAQRGRLAKVVSWWHDVEQQLKDWCGTLAEGQALSGFNAFTKRNVKDLFDDVNPRIVPLNSPVNGIANLAGEAGGASNDVDLTWDTGEATGTDKVYVLAGLAGEGGAYPANLFLVSKESVNVSVGELAASDLLPTTAYWFFVMVESVALSRFSVAAAVLATSSSAD